MTESGPLNPLEIAEDFYKTIAQAGFCPENFVIKDLQPDGDLDFSRVVTQFCAQQNINRQQLTACLHAHGEFLDSL